jgi:bifunctional non-homologous end joining protein LigD
MGLEIYQQKRNFKKTPEPKGHVLRHLGRSFVIQKHQASHLHYDFRLEMNGVLRSWAVPKGPALDPKVRRLAIEVEDHPLQYADFEGLIPEKQYGAGEVIVWDNGQWICEGDPIKAYEKGRIDFELKGKKLKGRWVLVRTKKLKGPRTPWFLIKRTDKMARKLEVFDVTERQKNSVISGELLEIDLPSRKKKVQKKLRQSKRSAQRPGQLTNLDKLLFEKEGITKSDLIEYYIEVADRMLPLLKDRPLTLLRCPNGAESACFIQKHSSKEMGRGIATFKLEGKSPGTYISLNSSRGLMELVQIGTLEIHQWVASRKDIDHPEQMVFDLDPAPDLTWPDVIKAAKDLNSLLEQLGLKSLLKLSGGKGVHLHVPIAPKYTWEQVKYFAQTVAKLSEERDPKRFISSVSKAKRAGKIFVDYLRNGYGATAVSAYSTRHRPGVPCAVPIFWDELTRSIEPHHFTIEKTVARLQKLSDDPWKDFNKLKQNIDVFQ